MNPPERSDRFHALSDLIRARCWASGFIAPLEWVHWLLDLELDHITRRDHISRHAAEGAVSFEQATALGATLIETTEHDERAPDDI